MYQIAGKRLQSLLIRRLELIDKNENKKVQFEQDQSDHTSQNEVDTESPNKQYNPQTTPGQRSPGEN